MGRSSLLFSFTFPVTLFYANQSFSVSDLIDSSAADNLIDKGLVEERCITSIPCTQPLRIMAIDSQPIGGGYLTCQTVLLEL